MAQQRHLTLLVPGLTAPLNTTELPSAETAPTLIALPTLLARSYVSELLISGMEAQLFQLFDIPIPAGDLPVAAVTHTLDSGKIISGWRMRCDPVHLVPGYNSLILAGSDELEISTKESDAFVSELNDFFCDKGWCFEALTSTRWYLTLPQAPQLQTHPLPNVLGCSIDSYLPGGEESARWHSLLAEVQMLLHGSQTNLQRESRGEPTINSLWFWGGGTLPEAGLSRWSRVWSNEVVGNALAGITDTVCSPVPGSVREWLVEAAGGEHLLVLDSGRYIPRFEETFSWLEWLQLMDENWFAPLLLALKKGELDRLDIYTGNSRMFRVTRRSLRHWWKRRCDILSCLGANE